jgi:hypothetical protein
MKEPSKIKLSPVTNTPEYWLATANGSLVQRFPFAWQRQTSECTVLQASGDPLKLGCKEKLRGWETEGGRPSASLRMDAGARIAGAGYFMLDGGLWSVPVALAFGTLQFRRRFVSG